MKKIRFGNNTMPRISFEVTVLQGELIREKCKDDGYSIKEVGIRLFDKWIAGKVELPQKPIFKNN